MSARATVFGLLLVLTPLHALAQDADGLEPLRRHHRSARAAVIMSIPFPGWGQLYADNPFWAVAAFSVQSYYLGSMLLERRRVERQRVRRDRLEPGSAEREFRETLITEHRERIRDFVWWSTGAVLLIALDAYVSVELADFDVDEPPTPDLDREWPQSGSAGDGAGLALRLNFTF